MQSFAGKLAVITGAAGGMGRELAIQLAAEGCHLALADLSTDGLAETAQLCRAAGSEAIEISTHQCDVADEAQVLAFRDAVQAVHGKAYINLLFNNAGIGGGGSFINTPRQEWEQTFNVCWNGVYYCTRAFLPLLINSDDGCLVNTSSVNGFWASLGPGSAHTAYSTAKFAVKGFTEALINDLRMNAPHVKVALVMPGHIGTAIAQNTSRILGHAGPLQMSAEEVAATRLRLERAGLPVANVSDDALKQLLHQQQEDFKNNAPTSAAQAATIILDGVREGRWRILVGEDAHRLDERVRANPEQAYDTSFFSLLPGRR